MLGQKANIPEILNVLQFVPQSLKNSTGNRLVNRKNMDFRGK